MKRFEIYSAQTGHHFGQVVAQSEVSALDIFAQQRHWRDAKHMWDAGFFEYVSAYAAFGDQS